MEELGNKLFNSKFLENWHCHFHNLKAWLEQNRIGDLLLTTEMDEELVKWIGIQNKIKNKLPAELRNKLAVLNFDLDQKGDIWEHKCRQLALFAQENGHINLPDGTKYEALKDWSLRQIQNKPYLSESQINKLEKLGIDWDLTFTREQRWNLMFLKLKEFHLTYGHCQVPQKWERDKTLANWVRVQRTLRAAHKLRQDRESKLNSLNFVWHIQTLYDAQWQHYYQQLKAFFQEHGHCRVPGKYKQLTS